MAAYRPVLNALFFLSIVFLAQPAHAFELGEAERAGATVQSALQEGRRGNWSAAESIARGSGDPLVQDIVLWRKLRAGQGSVREYQAFVARRGTWPGQEQLAKAVLGERPAPESGGRLTGAALDRWRSFSQIWRRRDYDAAARYLVDFTADRGSLGNPAVWAERRRTLARREAREGRPSQAYRLAAQHHLTPEIGYAYADLEWIAGWVALRKQNDPGRAIAHFERFEAAVETPISLGRGGYWVGRAYEAAGDIAKANAAYQRGAEHQTSFYGQLAAAKLGLSGDAALVAKELPDWRKSPAIRSDDVRLAAVLHFAGQDSLAFQTFSHLGKRMEGGAALGALADLTLELGMPHYAVRISKHAARRGVVLHPSYYPVTPLASYASKVEPALAMSIARQETELNPRAISPAGARGLMQVMPATARRVAGWIGEEYSKSRLTQDWRYNARLGQSYLARRVGQFDGSYVMAAAAYNAGKGRVDEWIARYGDPRTGRIDMIDWMESIPFNETRNYVQRVMEGLYVYRARLAGTTGPMTIEADLGRGVRRTN